MTTYVPTYQGLAATDFVRSARSEAMGFPFDARRRMPFYRARNAIYHLFRVLTSNNPRLSVLAPDYNSGNEVLALEAAGAKIHYCTVGRTMQLDPQEVERLCRIHNPDVLYVIHYLGWPQPMQELKDLCRRREMLLVEDCALSLLSELDGRPLGSFGQWSVFCLYKTLPVPDGALLVQNAAALEALERLRLRPAGLASVAGHTAELLVQRIRGRANGVGSVLRRVKRSMGRAAGLLQIPRANVGDIGFNLSETDLAMSGTAARLLQRLNFDEIRRQRSKNYRWLANQLDGRANLLHRDLPDGVCPLFFPILVQDKHAAAEALQRRGVDALEFWNYGAEVCDRTSSATARFLRAHVLELPVHQDLTPKHLAHMAHQVSNLNLRMA